MRRLERLRVGYRLVEQKYIAKCILLVYNVMAAVQEARNPIAP